MPVSYDLSIIIPARNEEFVSNTVKDILDHKEANTEVIVVLDGLWADPGIVMHPDANVVKLDEPIGQRAATNLGAKIASGEYLMKLDAHCSFDQGFDRKLLEDIQPDWTMVPLMKNLHVFSWVCNDCNWEKYQGPLVEQCPKCNSDNVSRKMVWKPKAKTTHSTAYRVTPQLEFKYFPELKKRQEGELVETMSLQGSCFVAHRDKYWGLKLCDESYGSWGGQGAEVALKTWLSGGKVICTKKTWYAHLFRTQKGFSFSYPNPGRDQLRAKNTLRSVFLNDSWEHAVHPLSWLVEKFRPVPDWHDADGNLIVEVKKKPKPKPKKRCKKKKKVKKGILYYTDNRLPDKYALPVRRQLEKANLPIISSSIDVMDWGNNIHIDLNPGYMTMFNQIINGLYIAKEMGIDIIFFAEHDVLYHPSHFSFDPRVADTFYYNENVWKVHATYGFALHYHCQQTSGLCANRELLIDHYQRRIDYINNNESADIRKIGFEPGTHGRIPELAGKSKGWCSDSPNIDIRHEGNLTRSRWWKHQFRNQKYTEGWKTSDTIPGWGKTLLRFDEFLDEI